MKFILVALSTIVALSHGFSLTSNEWVSFKSTHNKQYANKVEEQMRLRIFAKNVEEINEHNKKYELGLSTFKRGINPLTDMTPEEIQKNLMGFRPSDDEDTVCIYHQPNGVKTLPEKVDWTETAGVVTPVKNQQQCGSCWAFSSTGGLEGQYMLRKNRSVSLSEQNLVDCDPRSFGCSGGWMDWAYKYVVENEGLDTESEYPYRGVNQACQYKKTEDIVTVTNCSIINNDNEDDLKEAVANVGPIPVAFDANHGSFFSYSSGIWDEPTCDKTYLCHAVLVVGYGTEDNVDYWLVKNSWDTTWGMQGYFKMRRNNGDKCGFARHAVYPIL